MDFTEKLWSHTLESTQSDFSWFPFPRCSKGGISFSFALKDTMSSSCEYAKNYVEIQHEELCGNSTVIMRTNKVFRFNSSFLSKSKIFRMMDCNTLVRLFPDDFGKGWYKETISTAVFPQSFSIAISSSPSNLKIRRVCSRDLGYCDTTRWWENTMWLAGKHQDS